MPLDGLALQFFSESEKKRAQRIANFFRTTKDPSLRLCPNEKCEQGLLRIRAGEPNVECGSCRKKYCNGCLLPEHEGDC